MTIQAILPVSDIHIPLSDTETALTNYAAGKLSPAKHTLVSYAIELNPKLAQAGEFNMAVAASMLDDVRPVALSPLFMGKVLEKLSFERSEPVANDRFATPTLPGALKPLIKHIDAGNIPWKSLFPGVAIHEVLGNRKSKRGERLYLLKVKSGMQMPEHSHDGQEWALIISGSYSVNQKIYRRGDLHIENEHTSHSPLVCEGEDCICLVMTEAPLVMKGLLPKLVQRVVGI